MDDYTKKSYAHTLRDIESRELDLQRQIAALQVKLRKMQETAQTMKQLIAEESGQTLLPSPAVVANRFTTLSTRWAILCLLSEAEKSLTVQEIADELMAGGIRTLAANFANNVTSVLSQMRNRTEPEVSTEDGKWTITDTGKSAWRHIREKHASRMRRRGFMGTADVEAPAVPH